MKNLFKYIIPLLFVSSAGFSADPNCDSIESCNQLGKKVDARLAEILKVQTKFLPVPKDSNNNFLKMTYPNSLHYCEGQQAHLVTARELGQYFMNYGARGIIELTEPKPNVDTKHIKSFSTQGAPDFFYFDPTGLKPPQEVPFQRLTFVIQHAHRGYASLGFYYAWDSGFWQVQSAPVAAYDTPDFNPLCVKNEPVTLPPSSICSDSEDCNQLRTMIGEKLTLLQSKLTRQFILGPENADGSLKEIPHAEALNYCTSKGAHLATARDMIAYVAPKVTGNLITEELYFRSDKTSYVRTIEIDGKNDGFYFGGDLWHIGQKGNYLTSSRDGANLSFLLDGVEYPNEFWLVLSMNSQDVRLNSTTFRDKISGMVVCVK